MRCHMRETPLLPPARQVDKLAFPVRKHLARAFGERERGGARRSPARAPDPISGRNAFTALATPVIRPPPPIAAMMATVSGASSRISRPSIHARAMKLSSSKWMENVPATPG